MACDGGGTCTKTGDTTDCKDVCPESEGELSDNGSTRLALRRLSLIAGGAHEGIPGNVATSLVEPATPSLDEKYEG